MAMIPAPELQVDIFVTNVKYAPKPTPALQRIPSDNASLAPPAPQFARHGQTTPRGRPSSTGSADSDYESDLESFVDLSYYTGDFGEQSGELGHEEHVLDLTNFEGDDDTAMPGETQFNQSVKREGKLRRQASQRAADLLNPRKKKRESRNDHYPPTQMPGSTVRLVARDPSEDFASRSSQEAHRAALSHLQTDLAHSPCAAKSPVGRPFSPTSMPMQSPHSTLVPTPSSSTIYGFSDSPNRDPKRSSEVSGPSGPSERVMTRPLSNASQMSGWSEAGSLAALIAEVEVPRSRSGEQIKLELDEQEMQDVGFVAEHARPGKPRLDRILADEVRQAQGAIVVGCELVLVRLC